MIDMVKSEIEYNGQDYPCILIACPKGHPGPFEEGEEMLIASDTLYNLLWSQIENGTENANIARFTDEQVDYYVPDEMLDVDEKTLAQYLIDNY